MQSGMSTTGGYSVNIRVPNVFGNFEATLGVLGADAFLLFIFIICTWKLSCKDVAKPFLCILSLSLLVSTVGVIALFVFRMCNLSDDAAAYASIVNTIGRFMSMNTLLFGGGYYLMGAGNAARTREPSACCSCWLIHFTIAVFSGVVAYFTIFFQGGLENIPLFMYKVMPTVGVLFLIFGFVMGFLLTCCEDSEKKTEATEKFLVDAKSRFMQYIIFFIVPVTMVVLTRALDGGNFMCNVFMRSTYGHYGFYWDRLAIGALAETSPMIRGIGEYEIFFTISVVLSALILHPSVRNVFFCSSKNSQAKIIPIDASSTLPFTSGHAMYMTPMMMPTHQIMPSPQMTLPPQMSLPPPQTTIPSMSHPMVHAPLPPLNHYPVVYGMGGRPYMMA